MRWSDGVKSETYSGHLCLKRRWNWSCTMTLSEEKRVWTMRVLRKTRKRTRVGIRHESRGLKEIIE
jgi:hypothetical protein